TALRRRLRGLRLARIRIPFQAFPLMAGLPAPLAVLPALPLGLLPGPPALLRPDPLLRRRSPRVGAVHPQPALQLSQPQLQPLPQLPLGVQLSPQQRVLRVLRLHHGPQPGVRSTKPRSVISQGLTGHAPQAPTATASRQIDKRRSRLCHGPRLKAQATARTDITLRPREWTPVICTTNAIESINARLRRAVNARGHFPTEQAALKCLYLAIRSLDPTGKGRKR